MSVPQSMPAAAGQLGRGLPNGAKSLTRRYAVAYGSGNAAGPLTLHAEAEAANNSLRPVSVEGESYDQ